MDEKYVPLNEASRMLGVAYITVWKWYKTGKIKGYKLPNGKIVIPLSEIERLLPGKELRDTRRAVIYARVSSRKQAEQGDLDRQVEALRRFASENGYEVVSVITDVGSGLNTKRRGLRKLFEKVVRREIDYVLITHRDRLTRFGYDYLKYFFKQFGVTIVEAFPQSKEPMEELVEDFVELVVSFAGRIYGRRSHQAKKVARECAELLLQKQ